MAADTKSPESAAIRLPRNTLVLLVGPAGCGKSTFAARHFRPTQVVSSDECRALISDDPANQRVSGHAFDLMHFIIEKRLLVGKFTVCDATNLDAGNRKSIVKMARSFAFNTAAIVFYLSLETCVSRNSRRRRVVPQEALRNQFAMFEKAKQSLHGDRFDYVYIINQGGQSRALVEISPRAKSRPIGERP
jgi:protein phosphatase